MAAWNRDVSPDGTERAAAVSSRSGGRPRGAAYLARARRILDCAVQAEDVAGDGADPQLRGRGTPRPRRGGGWGGPPPPPGGGGGGAAPGPPPPPRRAGDRRAPLTGRLLSVETVPETDHRDIVLSPHLHDRIAALTAPEPTWTASTGTAA